MKPSEAQKSRGVLVEFSKPRQGSQKKKVQERHPYFRVARGERAACQNPGPPRPRAGKPRRLGGGLAAARARARARGERGGAAPRGRCVRPRRLHRFLAGPWACTRQPTVFTPLVCFPRVVLLVLVLVFRCKIFRFRLEALGPQSDRTCNPAGFFRGCLLLVCYSRFDFVTFCGLPESGPIFLLGLLGYFFEAFSRRSAATPLAFASGSRARRLVCCSHFGCVFHRCGAQIERTC